MICCCIWQWEHPSFRKQWMRVSLQTLSCTKVQVTVFTFWTVAKVKSVKRSIYSFACRCLWRMASGWLLDLLPHYAPKSWTCCLQITVGSLCDVEGLALRINLLAVLVVPKHRSFYSRTHVLPQLAYSMHVRRVQSQLRLQSWTSSTSWSFRYTIVHANAKVIECLEPT